MILSLVASLVGGLMRLMPEVFAFLNKKTDNTHELAMLDRQFKLEATRAASRMAEIQYQGGVDETLALLDAQKSALTGQMQKVGIKWVDALNFAVRPLTTYYMLILYGVAKLAMFITAVKVNGDAWQAVLMVYDAEDRALLCGILSFWFVGRVIDKR